MSHKANNKTAFHSGKRPQIVKKASQSSRPQARKKSGSFSAAACTSPKILYSPQVWNFCAKGAKIMRAEDCKSFQTRTQRSGSRLKACQKYFFDTLARLFLEKEQPLLFACMAGDLGGLSILNHNFRFSRRILGGNGIAKIGWVFYNDTSYPKRQLRLAGRSSGRSVFGWRSTKKTPAAALAAWTIGGDLYQKER